MLIEDFNACVGVADFEGTQQFAELNTVLALTLRHLKKVIYEWGYCFEETKECPEVRPQPPNSKLPRCYALCALLCYAQHPSRDADDIAMCPPPP